MQNRRKADAKQMQNRRKYMKCTSRMEKVDLGGTFFVKLDNIKRSEDM